MRTFLFIALLVMQSCYNRLPPPDTLPSQSMYSDTLIRDLPYETGEIIDTIINIK